MEDEIDPHSIVVGVDGSEHAERAVHWATEQAHLEGRPLVLVATVNATAGAGWLDIGAAYTYEPRAALEGALALAEESLALVRRIRPGVRAAATARLGDPRVVLVDLSRRVHLVVVGSRGRGSLRSRLLGSVSAVVVRDAECPVVVCRPRDPTDPADQGILVGADGTVESGPVLDFAFAQASRTDQALTVMHTIWDERAAAEGPELASAREPGLDEPRLLLSESVAGFRSTYPDVDVDLVLARGLAEECLADTNGSWDLIVVGRHPVDTVFRLMSGAVATAVLEGARTTVAMVPQAAPTE
ncbi:universal stress protein [Nocardioides sp. zg-536]|uniref:Universal stress protein n=1 Tax=Nocardioides faecalis TaxID=2803858 RepID=A0A939BZQ8_9ACTN|nr:universal stress protein [Nocardioides faecalis]MBM9461563.1 universal stress protein [Nocardioides faecalis]QVI57803.1 universal stress protein [Nocardioides faecalis]